PRNGVMKPYNPGEPAVNMEIVRWEPGKMPLLIYLSPGTKLPDASFSTLQQTRVDLVYQMLHMPGGDPFVGCSQVPGWTDETGDNVAAGIEQWREFQNEGLFSFAFTENPRNAHILIFFVDSFKDADAPGGISVGGNTCAKINRFGYKGPQLPVVIELSL